MMELHSPLVRYRREIHPFVPFVIPIVKVVESWYNISVGAWQIRVVHSAKRLYSNRCFQGGAKVQGEKVRAEQIEGLKELISQVIAEEGERLIPRSFLMDVEEIRVCFK